MWFVSKKKYDAMVAERDRWDNIAAESTRLCQKFREQAARWEEVACSCQEDNKRLVALSEEMLSKMKELEAELQRARQDNQQWASDFEELDIAYGWLEVDYDVLRNEHAALCRKAEELREERDHYKQYCCHLENELLYYQGGEGENE